MNLLSKRLPHVILILVGMFMTIQYFIPHSAVQSVAGRLLQWKQPLNGVVVLCAVAGIARFHWRRVESRQKGWAYSVITLGAMGAMILAGLVGGTEQDTLFMDWFNYLLSPIESTMFALLAFFVARAALRAADVGRSGAWLLFAAALAVILAMIPPVSRTIPVIGTIQDTLLQVPNTAAKRAILIGASLSGVAVALKSVLGLDRTLLDGVGDASNETK